MGTNVYSALEKRVSPTCNQWELAEPFQATENYNFKRLEAIAQSLKHIQDRTAYLEDHSDTHLNPRGNQQSEIDTLFDQEDELKKELFDAFYEPPYQLTPAFETDYIVSSFQKMLFHEFSQTSGVPSDLSPALYQYLYHKVLTYGEYLSNYAIDLNQTEDISIAWFDIDNFLNYNWNEEHHQHCYVTEDLRSFFPQHSEPHHHDHHHCCESFPSLNFPGAERLREFPTALAKDLDKLKLQRKIKFCDLSYDPLYYPVWYKTTLIAHYGYFLNEALLKFQRLRNKHSELRLIYWRC